MKNLFKKSRPPTIFGELNKDMIIKQGYNAETKKFWFKITKYHTEPGTAEIMDGNNQKVTVARDAKFADEEMYIAVPPEFFKAFHGQSALITWIDVYGGKAEDFLSSQRNKPVSE